MTTQTFGFNEVSITTWDPHAGSERVKLRVALQERTNRLRSLAVVPSRSQKANTSGFLVQTHGLDYLGLGLHALGHARVRETENDH